MTPAQQKARLRRIVKAWKARLGLQAWNVGIEWDINPEDDDAWASVEVSSLYDVATIRFRDDWMEHDLFQLNRIVVHELLHILFNRMGQAARRIGNVGLSGDARALWYDECHDEEEGLIDRLANRFVELGGAVE